MNDKWKEYLHGIGIREGLFQRVEQIIAFYEEVYDEPLIDIFVTDLLDKEGNRSYESLWFFSQKDVMEAKNFIIADDFDSVPLRVRYWNITKTNYDFKESTDSSRMILDFTLESGIGGKLRASAMNCDSLREIFVRHILSHVIRNP